MGMFPFLQLARIDSKLQKITIYFEYSRFRRIFKPSQNWMLGYTDITSKVSRRYGSHSNKNIFFNEK